MQLSLQFMQLMGYKTRLGPTWLHRKQASSDNMTVAHSSSKNLGQLLQLTPFNLFESIGEEGERGRAPSLSLSPSIFLLLWCSIGSGEEESCCSQSYGEGGIPEAHLEPPRWDDFPPSRHLLRKKIIHRRPQAYLSVQDHLQRQIHPLSHLLSASELCSDRQGIAGQGRWERCVCSVVEERTSRGGPAAGVSGSCSGVADEPQQEYVQIQDGSLCSELPLCSVDLWT